MFFEHADCLIGICKDVDTCSSQVLTLDLTKYDEVPQTNNAVDNDNEEVVDQNAVSFGHGHDVYSHVVDDNGRIVDYSPRGNSNRDGDYEEGVVVASSSGGGGSGGGGSSGGSGGAKGRGSTRSMKERRGSSSKRKSNESGGSKMIYREVIVEETDADVEENDG
jgi:hypothetical protein